MPGEDNCQFPLTDFERGHAEGYAKSQLEKKQDIVEGYKTVVDLLSKLYCASQDRKGIPIELEREFWKIVDGLGLHQEAINVLSTHKTEKV